MKNVIKQAILFVMLFCSVCLIFSVPEYGDPDFGIKFIKSFGSGIFIGWLMIKLLVKWNIDNVNEMEEV